MKPTGKAVAVVVGLVLVACAPDDPEHPCDPESGSYTGCEKVGVGEECMTHEQCDGDNLVCAGGKCVCIPECSGFECGDDGCGGSCGECESGLQCGGEQQCIDPSSTWTDPNSGHIWQVEPTGGTMKWYESQSHCQALPLAGGGWRLPDIGELRSLIRGCPATELSSDACNVQPGGCLESTCNDGSLCASCAGNSGPAGGCYWPEEMEGKSTWYWSSSPVAASGSSAWSVNFGSGYVGNYGVDGSVHVRCIR